MGTGGGGGGGDGMGSVAVWVAGGIRAGVPPEYHTQKERPFTTTAWFVSELDL